MELIYEVTSSVLRKTENEIVSVSDSLYDIGGVDYVNIVMQNDEISN